MHTVNTSYSLIFQCDSRTTLSIALSLLAAVATAVALGVLAHYGYINPTTAYATAPAIGTVLMMIGGTVALIRKDTASKSVIPPSLNAETRQPRGVVGLPKGGADTQPKRVQDPAQIKHYFDTTKTVQLVPYRPNTDYYLRRCKPTQDVPYHCLKVQIALEGTTELIEVEVLEAGYYSSTCYKLKFQYLDTQYNIQMSNGFGIAIPWEEYARNQDNLLLREDYQRLLDLRGPATLLMFTEENQGSTGKTYFSQKEFPKVTYEGKVVTFTRTHRTPIRSLEGLDEFPEICKRLQEHSWTWKAPYDITLIGEGPQQHYHSQKGEWVSQFRVEWQISNLEVLEALNKTISSMESSL